MQNSGDSVVDNNIQTTENETLKVSLNEDQFLVVNKEKLFEKSDYFKLITKSSKCKY